MNKKEIIFIVEDYSSSTEDWMIEAYENGVYIGVTATFEDGGMVDEEMGSVFPELSVIGLEDEVEGYMVYSDDDITPKELVQKLKEIGFEAKLA